MFRIMKSLEFRNSENQDVAPDQAKSLETLLLEKNRSLQTENTKLKNLNLDASGKCCVVDRQM